jgi:hypothetical protein
MLSRKVATLTLSCILALASVSSLLAQTLTSISDTQLQEKLEYEKRRLINEAHGADVNVSELEAGLNRLSFELVPDDLYTRLKDQNVVEVMARIRLENHLYRLSLARTALMLYHGSEAKMREATRGLSESEIITLAESLK